MKTLTLYFLIVSMSFLYACSSRNLMTMPASDLCVSYINGWGYSATGAEKYEAIKSRNINCDEYRELAKIELEKRERIASGLEEVLDSAVDVIYPPQDPNDDTLNCTSRTSNSGTTRINCN